MWDVKEITPTRYPVSLSPVSLSRFYLNYVGCKVKLIQYQCHHEPRFYLNYVGCKVEIPGMGIKYVNKSFTLTMWDVKASSYCVIPSSKSVLP